MLLVWLFKGDTNSLIPLYAIGVFVCFTLSQAGMVMHWLRTKEEGWRWRAALNGVGAVATAIVSVIQIVTKFAAGAWIVALIIPLFILLLQSIHTHYRRFAIDIAFRGRSPILPHEHTVVVPISAVNKATAAALVYATTLSRNVRAIHIEVDPKATPKLEREWDRWDIGYELEIVPSPYRSVVRPIVDYVMQLQRGNAGRARDGGHAGAGAAALVGVLAAQQHRALHPHGVPVQAARRGRGGAVSRRPRIRARGARAALDGGGIGDHRRGHGGPAERAVGRRRLSPPPAASGSTAA